MFTGVACGVIIILDINLLYKWLNWAHVLYNDCWHGFWVRSRWPRVLWQAVTLWLVNREMAVCRGRLVEQVYNRKETTWYENHVVRFRVQSEPRVKPGIRSRSEASLTIRLARGCKRWHPWPQEEDWGRKNSSLWVFVSPSITQTYNKLSAAFENKMWEINFFKEVCFVRSLKFVHYHWLCSGWGLWEVYKTRLHLNLLM